jgi:hypothetical protein
MLFCRNKVLCHAVIQWCTLFLSWIPPFSKSLELCPFIW